MKQTIRAFSIGLLTSGIILLVIFFLFDGGNNKQTDISSEEMITSLEDDGYHVLSDSDYVDLSVTKEKEKEKNDNQKNNDSNEAKDNAENNDDENTEEQAEDDEKGKADNDDSDEPKEATTYKLTIEEGMASSDISQKLADNDIIDDAGEFNKFLQVEGFDEKVQIGEFELTGDMDFQEIASTITN